LSRVLHGWKSFREIEFCLVLQIALSTVKLVLRKQQNFNSISCILKNLEAEVSERFRQTFVIRRSDNTMHLEIKVLKVFHLLRGRKSEVRANSKCDFDSFLICILFVYGFSSFFPSAETRVFHSTKNNVRNSSAAEEKKVARAISISLPFNCKIIFRLQNERR
jgi:hypothetical protein